MPVYTSRTVEVQNPSGLTEAQAREFHAQFTRTYTVFVALAAVVHVLIYMWKPWF